MKVKYYNNGEKPIKIKVTGKKEDVEPLRKAITQALRIQKREGNCKDGYIMQFKTYKD